MRERGLPITNSDKVARLSQSPATTSLDLLTTHLSELLCFCLPTPVLGDERPALRLLEGGLLHAVAASLIMQNSMQSVPIVCRWANHKGPTTCPNMIRLVIMQEDVVSIPCATPDTQLRRLAHLLHRSQPGKCCKTTSPSPAHRCSPPPTTTCRTKKKNTAAKSRSTGGMLLIGRQRSQGVRREQGGGWAQPAKFYDLVSGPAEI